jgi:arylsulfatase A-like enzyme
MQISGRHRGKQKRGQQRVSVALGGKAARRTAWGPVATALLAVAAGLVATWPLAAQQATRPPNVVLFLIDDLGWTDLACYGSTFYETPHIDRLAASGLRLTQGYSACTVCSPTRAALLTGKYPARLHVTDWIPGHQRPYARLRVPPWRQYLAHEETTLAEMLAARGYVTCHLGKWHLGDEPYWPTTQGFQFNLGGNHRGQPPSYFFPYERPGIPLPGLSQGMPGEYLTDRLTNEALAFLDKFQDRPFFLYFSHYAVHTPLQAPADKIAKYQAKAKPDQPQHNATYAAMIESVDESVGRVLARLEALKLRDKTIVIFTSDNGGLKLNEVTDNAPLRDGKGSAYEGGVRVPWIIAYPPLVAPGSVSDTPVMTIDVLPTLAELCDWGQGAPPPCDGVSLVPLLRRPDHTFDRPLFWHYPHYHPGGATPYGAVRQGDWRLVEFYEDGRLELYNLREDPGESRNLAATHPEQRDALHRLLRQWRTAVDAQMPTPNPDHDPARDQPARGKKAKAKAANANPSAGKGELGAAG